MENLAKENVLVVVHLFDPHSTKSIELQDMLVSLAPVEFQGTKFLCLDICKNNIEVDKVALPMLQVYQNGELMDTIAPVHLEVLIVMINLSTKSRLSVNFIYI